MLLNLRALPHGLESHKEFLQDEIGLWLEHTEQADVTFICSGSRTVRLVAHQAVLAPISPILRDIFNQQSCGHRREMVNITMDTDPKVMQSVLSLIYRGTATLSTQAVEELKSIVKMLGLTFPGGFERVIMTQSDSALTATPDDTSNQTQTANNVTIKRPHPPSPPQESKKPRPSPANRPRPSPANRHILTKPSPTTVKASATDRATERMNMHVSLTLQLKDAPSGTTATCKMPNCGAEVTYEQLSDHFLLHETSDNSNESNTPISFPCVACGVNFKYRRELESHTKNKHGGGIANMRDKLDLLSDSDSSSDEDTFETETTSTKSTKKTPVTCPQCNIVVPSTWHLPPSKHDCSKVVSPLVIKRPASSNSDWSIDAPNYCKICDHTFKTTMAKNVHMKMKHSSSKEKTSLKTPAKLLMDAKLDGAAASSSWKKYGCQICTKRFNDFCKLRTHYTLYHFWDNLSEDYKFMGDQCNICMRKYPTEDHLIQHLGNFHCLIDKYLVKKGLRIISSEKTVKLLSWRCEFCKVNQTSSAALKSHLAVKHYQKELIAEFPVERGKTKRCPKCYKIFDGSSISTVVGHVGSFHDEVIKYAMDVLDLDETDKDNIPVDDFDDGTVGVPVERDDISCFKCEKCDNISKTRTDLKNHYLDQHYAGQFVTTYPVPFCSFCDQEYMGLAVLHKHMVNKHESVLCSMLAKDGIIIPKENSPRRRKQVVHKGPFDFLFCQICLQEFQSSKTLKIHYIRHYQQHFQTQYFTIKCPYCDKTFGDVMTTQKHIASEHEDLSLIPLMEKEMLWVDKSVILEPACAKLKRIGIPMKKLDNSIVKKHFDELEELSPVVEKNFDCVFPSCDRVSDTREKFLIHLAISHFWKDLSLEFGESFEADSINCPICKEKINPNQERTIYYKHLAVAHEAVMKYVQTIGREEPRIVQKLTSPTFLVQKLVVNTAHSNSAATKVPVIRFSNETASEDAYKNGANNSGTSSDFEIGNNLKSNSENNVSPLVNGSLAGASGTSEPLPIQPEEIKNEITTEDNLPSAVNSDIISKVRSAFSDDSDSDSD